MPMIGQFLHEIRTITRTDTILGGWLADEYWGKFKTIYVAIVVATFGHILILIAAIPQVIASPKGALASFILGLILFGTGVGFFKACISPLIAEQCVVSSTSDVKTTDNAPDTKLRTQEHISGLKLMASVSSSTQGSRILVFTCATIY